MRRGILIGVAVLLFALAAIDIGVFVVSFSTSPLSQDPASWGQFGDYVGGTLNPLLSFGAFIGVLFTIHLQNKHLDHAKHQAVVEEMQRLASSASQGLDEQLRQRIPKPWVVEKSGEHPSLWLVIAGLGAGALNKAPKYDELRAKVLPDSGVDIDTFLIDLKQLVWILIEYERSGGTHAVATFYKKRYEVVVSWLYAADLLMAHQSVYEYFRPDQIAPGLATRVNGAG